MSGFIYLRSVYLISFLCISVDFVSSAAETSVRWLVQKALQNFSVIKSIALVSL